MTGGAPRVTAGACGKPRREGRLTLFQKAGATAPGEGRQGWGAGGKQSQNWRCSLQMTGTSPKHGPGWWSSHVWLYFLFLLQLGD